MQKISSSNKTPEAVQTLVPGNNPRKGALLKDTRALTLRGNPWLSREGLRRGTEPAESSWASSGCFSKYDSWKQRQSSRFRNCACRRQNQMVASDMKPRLCQRCQGCVNNTKVVPMAFKYSPCSTKPTEFIPKIKIFCFTW